MTDLPPEAAGRVRSRAFSSGLSVNDFAACLHSGLRPVALVQGYCVMRWTYAGSYGYYQPYGTGAQRNPYTGFPNTTRSYYRAAPNTISSYSCPHYYAGVEHRSWGYNYEQKFLTQTWHEGFNQAYRRMIEEAAEAGAHGVIGVVDTARSFIDSSLREFHIYGTAVVADGEPPVPQERIWSTYLAGQRLAKLIESGFMPTSITASMASVRMWAVCMTEVGMRGGYGNRYLQQGYQSTGAITQLADAHMQARRLARDHIKSALGPDSLYGADLRVAEFEMGEGDVEVDCVLRGTRVRRARAADPLPPPQLTVRLND